LGYRRSDARRVFVMPPHTKCWSAKPDTKFIVVKVPIRFHGVLTPNAKLPSKIDPASAPLALTSSEQLDKESSRTSRPLSAGS